MDMKRFFTLLLMLPVLHGTLLSQAALDSLLPVRGLCIAAPDKENLDRFVKFIEEELVPMNVNTLVLRIDYDYEYISRPELRSDNPLSKADVKKLVEACRQGGIRLIPQVNLLGHQSWYQRVGMLLKVYPEFNETPWVPVEAGSGDMEWPNEWGLYCLSYCPLHPEVHEVVFDVVDEIVEVFEADAFHAGMDEVFYLGDDKCPRCSGRDKAELFAGEVNKIRDHLALRGKELWIWGDRMIDGKTTGIGEWAASMNNTHRSIDMIAKDVVINDWHYNRPEPTAILFAMKGYKVISCPYARAEVAKEQLRMMVDLKEHATGVMADNYYGMMQTVWTSARNFLDEYYGIKEAEGRRGNQVECFKVLFEEIYKLRD
jgi:hypothetical protein